MRTRAAENGVVYVAALYEPARSMVVDRDGSILVDAAGQEGVHVAEVDLTPGFTEVVVGANRRLEYRCLKDMYRKERRPQAYAALGPG